jgi:hypothetical protein
LDSVSTRTCPHFHSIAIVLPSTWPSSFKPSRNALVRSENDAGVPGRSTPIRGIFCDCCAQTSSGHVVVPPLPKPTLRLRPIAPCPHPTVLREWNVRDAGMLPAQAPLRLAVPYEKDPLHRRTPASPHPMTPANALLMIACASSWMRRKWSLPRKLSA